MNKQKFSLIVFIIGIFTLIAGAVALVLNFVIKPDMRDAEYLVEVGEWAEEENEGVIWKFTEIGKGTLTTNNHVNDYDFIWAIDGETLKIETKWLYDLNNDFTYKVNQSDKTLTLTAGETEYKFHAVEKQEEPVTEEANNQQISISVPQVALMPRFDKMTISSSGIMCVQWNSLPASLSIDSRAFFAIGLVVEQIDKAIRTSPSFK